jgi:crossover junction endodeoxyribonuclease RuvC
MNILIFLFSGFVCRFKNNFSLQKTSKIILGVDPGTLVMGYSIIEVTGLHLQVLEMNVLKLSAKKDAYERLRLIHHKIAEVIGKFHPAELAIEAPFFGKNVQSMLKLGRAQGVAIAAAMQCGLPVTEYSPKKIKQSITGNGNADKEQVWKMLQRMITVKHTSKYFDASDALAVAVCHYFQSKNGHFTGDKKLKGWEEFIKKNPERIKL